MDFRAGEEIAEESLVDLREEIHEEIRNDVDRGGSHEGSIGEIMELHLPNSDLRIAVVIIRSIIPEGIGIEGSFVRRISEGVRARKVWDFDLDEASVLPDAGELLHHLREIAHVLEHMGAINLIHAVVSERIRESLEVVDLVYSGESDDIGIDISFHDIHSCPHVELHDRSFKIRCCQNMWHYKQKSVEFNRFCIIAKERRVILLLSGKHAVKQVTVESQLVLSDRHGHR